MPKILATTVSDATLAEVNLKRLIQSCEELLKADEIETKNQSKQTFSKVCIAFLWITTKA